MKGKEKILLGAHMSIAGGVWKAVERAASINCTALQIFVKNSTQWKSNPLNEEDCKLFKSKLIEHQIDAVVVHSSYLINLCAANKNFLQQSRKALIDEIIRCDMLGITYLIFHPGSHMGRGEKEGIELVAESLNIVHEQTPQSKVITVLETTAGQGSAIGYRFEQLRQIIDLVEKKKRVAVCFDTSHVFAAGYDIRTEAGYEETFEQFASIISLKKLVAFHLNDSRKECGSRIDRHEHIGKGTLTLTPFRLLMKDPRFIDIPKILETPKGKDLLNDKKNMSVLLKLVEQNG